MKTLSTITAPNGQVVHDTSKDYPKSDKVTITITDPNGKVMNKP